MLGLTEILSTVRHKPSDQIFMMVDNKLKMHRAFVVNYKAYYL